jgi:hypothetical protein
MYLFLTFSFSAISWGGCRCLDFRTGRSTVTGRISLIGLFNSGTLTVSGGSVKTPEPGTLGFLACGLALFAGLASRKRVNALVAARG